MIKEPRLSDPKKQLDFLSNGIFNEEGLLLFKDQLRLLGPNVLNPLKLEIFQVNLGYMCNQTCKHCHVDAGPDRDEIMSRETMQICLDKMEELQVQTVDLTGGAPEMNPHFRWFVEAIIKRGIKEIIVRSNLTIILANPKYHDLPEFFKRNGVRVISSLPFFHASKTDRQRGKGVFDKSIRALQLLNGVGYGSGSLTLDLVYNPGGAFLPGDQGELERDFKKALRKEHGIEFNRLFTLTNLPINRYLEYLVASGNYEDYMTKLVEAFNPSAVTELMCRNSISIDYRGIIYDCDFNQMLEMPIETAAGEHISNLSRSSLEKREIQIGQHCYGCTAGAGSSCQGSLI